jgi:hypothetical protein
LHRKARSNRNPKKYQAFIAISKLPAYDEIKSLWEVLYYVYKTQTILLKEKACSIPQHGTGKVT